ncbi:asparagine synthase-domain-containing protein [Phakopsora pachyrhizi]|uniref:Asparagine synthase-domain-containing protein n=1 Tax=Phakopsora pachyrhizi TaxID=170000 RepID=A0AAV0BFC3_PHAPC|nr:asparagine synthase-domain-containing protein [Phakopsora pachyrhizi]
MVLEAKFYASVLHLCGSRPISQPMSSNRSDSLFLWNSVKGPYALISYNSKDKKIWFGRDPLGRKDIPDKQDRLKFVQLEDQPSSPEFLKASRLLRVTLDDSVKRMVTGISSLHQKTEKESRVAVLFSGGLDCTTLALLAHSHIPPSESIDLLNVAFENTRSISNNHQTKRIQKDSEKSSADNHNSDTTFDVPDCQTGERLWRELSKLTPGRDWRFVRVDARMAEYLEHKEKIIKLMRPNLTVMDLSIAAALYFAARGIGNSHLNERVGSLSPPMIYRTPARVLISGLGADKLLGGYSRHRSAFLTTSLSSNNWERLLDELAMDLERISTRNLGRDDWMMSWFCLEVRHPLLNRRVIDLLSGLPVHLKRDHGLGKGLGDNLLLRGLAHGLRLVESCRLPKRAIQFGAQSAKLDGNSKGQAA